MQKRWEQVDTAAEGDSSVKTHCPDGYPIRNHKDSLCEGKLLSKKENFCGGDFCDGAQEPRKDGWKQLALAMVAAAGLLVMIRVVNKRL
jgi:hypothetical protein